MATKRANSAVPKEPKVPKSGSKALQNAPPNPVFVEGNKVPVGALTVAGAVANVPPSSTEMITLPMPALCFTGEGHVISNMRKVIPYVYYHLQQVLKTRPEFNTHFRDQVPYLHQPLAIQADANADAMTSFKPP